MNNLPKNSDSVNHHSPPAYSTTPVDGVYSFLYAFQAVYCPELFVGDPLLIPEFIAYQSDVAPDGGIIYARVSTPPQRTHLDPQIAQLQRWFKVFDGPPDCSIYPEVCSGHTLDPEKRPNLFAAIRNAQATGDPITISNLGRLIQPRLGDTEIHPDDIKTLEDTGVIFVTLLPSLDPTAFHSQLTALGSPDHAEHDRRPRVDHSEEIEIADTLHRSLGSWKKVADKMGVSVRTLHYWRGIGVQSQG